MRTSEPREIENVLRQHKEFSECIIEEFVLRDYATTFEVVINYIWNVDGTIRSNVNEPVRVRLTFRSVQELRFINALTDQMLKNPEAINWGLNEVSLIRLEKDPVESIETLTQVAFLWEGDRRIDVYFIELEVISLP